MNTKARTVEEFRAAHDKSFIVPRKIKQALATLEKEGPESWRYEAEMIKLCALSQVDFAPYRDEFADFWFMVGGKNPKRIWCCTKALATKLRNMIS